MSELTASEANSRGRGFALPKLPLVDWGDLGSAANRATPHLLQRVHGRWTTSGRAAIELCLRSIGARPGDQVLLPSYHCPTMVAPVVRLGLRPVFYAIDQEGVPRWDRLLDERIDRVRACLVPHYFGRVRSMATDVEWCRSRGVALIEDCAHAFFGFAGGRPVGGWGDYSIASLTKFFAVPEAGLAVSATKIDWPVLQPTGWRAEIKAIYNMLEWSGEHKRLWPLGAMMATVGRLRRRRREMEAPAATIEPATSESLEAFMDLADMDRVGHEPTSLAASVVELTDFERTVRARCRNFAIYSQSLAPVSALGATGLWTDLQEGQVPYVWPLFVPDRARADRVYHMLRSCGVPVYRWDRLWPSTPVPDGDACGEWSHGLMQLLCHQGLTEDDIRWSASQVLEALKLTAEGAT